MKKNNLKSLRTNNGISLIKLSEKLKNDYDISVTPSQLNYYENGTRSPRDPQIWEALSKIFKVPTWYLLGYEPNFESVAKLSDPKEMQKLLHNFFKKIGKLEIEDYEELERIAEAYEGIEKHINNYAKYEKFGQNLRSFEHGYALLIQKLIMADKEAGTNYADILINYISLDDYDKKLVLDLIEKLANKDNKKDLPQTESPLTTNETQ